jgi:hypothetical protein
MFTFFKVWRFGSQTPDSVRAGAPKVDLVQSHLVEAVPKFRYDSYPQGGSMTLTDPR